MAATDSRKFDLVVYGATGATGSRTAEYLLRHAPDQLQWAIAGRSRANLDAVVARLEAIGPLDKVRKVGVEVATVDALGDLAKQTRVLASTVGPYARFGEPVVRACVENGTDYLDITGEPAFVRHMIDKYGELAKQRKVVLVSGCGFDSIPSDIGSYYLVQHAKRTLGCGVREVTNCVHIRKGGMGSGSVTTMVDGMGNPDTQKAMEPYVLVADIQDAPKYTEAPADFHGVVAVPELSTYGAMFPLALPNTRVVQRSATLFASGALGAPETMAYTRSRFRYREFLGYDRRLTAFLSNLAYATGAIALALVSLIPGVNERLVQFMLKNGWSPSQSDVEQGASDWELLATTDEDVPRQITATIRCQDPGYAETAKLFAESAMLLALRRSSLPVHDRGGYLTPATVFGDALVEALNSKEQWIHITS